MGRKCESTNIFLSNLKKRKQNIWGNLNMPTMVKHVLLPHGLFPEYNIPILKLQQQIQEANVFENSIWW